MRLGFMIIRYNELNIELFNVIIMSYFAHVYHSWIPYSYFIFYKNIFSTSVVIPLNAMNMFNEL